MDVTLWNPFSFIIIGFIISLVIFTCGNIIVERPELMAINAGCILLIIGFSAYLLSILKYCLLENRRELSSIFRRCSHIGTYRVYFLECGMLNDIEKVMGNVPVKHLIIYGSMFSSDNSVR